MKNLKSILALLLALVMVLSLAACGGNSAEDTKAPAADDDTTAAPADDTTAAPADDTTAAGNGLDWLNLGGVAPIVDEGVEKTLSICLPIDDETIDGYKDRWQYIHTTEVLNINLEVQAVPASAWGEKLPLIMADVENLPDLIMKTGWSTSQLLRYGAQEGLIVDIAPYLNEQYMPCLASLFADHPEYKVPWTDTEGRVWGVNFLTHTTRPDERHWFYLNYQWIIDCGLDPMTDLPETLDEFTDLMRKFKEVKSAEMGKEIYPISSRYMGKEAVTKYLLVALGYVGANRTKDFPGGDICVRNGKVVLPVADREAYEGFVKTLKLWYDEGLIHPEFFTGDEAAMQALISAGETGYVNYIPTVWVGEEPETLGQWWCAPLLTSEWCSEPAVPSNAAGNGCPTHVITTACEELELALAFYDWFYQRGTSCSNQNQRIDNHGVYKENTELAEKYPEFVLAEEDGKYGYQHVFNADEYVSAADMLAKRVDLWGNCVIGYAFIENEDKVPQMLYSDDTMSLFDKYTGTGVQSYEIGTELRAKYIQDLAPWAFYMDYLIDSDKEFPAVVFFDEETSEWVSDTYLAIKEYATTETAKFVTGQRDLSELTDYFDTLDELGAADYVQLHQDYFDAVKG